MSQEQLEALLGRPLSSIESSNMDLYLKIARESLDDLLCTSLCDSNDPKFYESRAGYSTVFTDIFTDVEEVKVDGEVIPSEDYSTRQWDRRNARWFNSLVFNRKLKGEDVEVSASWGFNKMPSDLQAVLAGLFDLVTKKNKSDSSIQSKQVEDFRISFDSDVDLDEDFYTKYRRTILKYSLCDIPNVQHGKIRCLNP